MVQISQTEEDIKISIELNRLITRKPDVVLLPQYLKFNSPPIFFERHLMQEIDELASFCRVFKNEARIILVKKQKGVWPEIFQKLNKEELMQKRLEIGDLIIERNKKRDEMAIERYENKRRSEIEKEVKRESAIRERVKQFQENACLEALKVDTRKDAVPKSKAESSNIPQQTRPVRLSTPMLPAMATVRGSGRINVCFSAKHKRETPKRESQEGINFPFTIHENPDLTQNPAENTKESLDNID